MSRRQGNLYLQDILTSIEKIQTYTQGLSFEEFGSDEEKIDAVVRNLEIIGEAARHMPGEIIVKYPQVPWEQMVRMRNKVLHEYFGIDEEILWQTVQEDLPELKRLLLSLSELSDKSL